MCAGTPHFTQSSFFSKSGLTKFSESLTLADSITSSSIYAPWSVVGTACTRQVMSDLCACWGRVVLRRRNAKDTSERWYHGGTPRSEAAPRPGVRVLDVLQEGRIEYVTNASPALSPHGPRKTRSSPSRRKRIISPSPVKLPRKFEISSPPSTSQKRSSVEDPSFPSDLTAQASRGKSRQSGRDRRAAPVFHMGYP